MALRIPTEKCKRLRHDDVHLCPAKADVVTCQAHSAQAICEAVHSVLAAEKACAEDFAADSLGSNSLAVGRL
jgi:hypothetical protein